LSSQGIAPPRSGSASNLGGSTIPLGATGLGDAGLSPMITVPAPNVLAPDPSTTPCAGPPALGSDPATSMNSRTTLGNGSSC
jgi:hypothetical protein